MKTNESKVRGAQQVKLIYEIYQFLGGTKEVQRDISLSHIKYSTSSASILLLLNWYLLYVYSTQLIPCIILEKLPLINKKRKILTDHSKIRLFSFLFFITD